MNYFDRWTSLGSFCLPKFQINRKIAVDYFDQPNDTASAQTFMEKADRKIIRQINGGNCIFDWTVVVDYDKIIRHLTEDFGNYRLHEESLKEVLKEDGTVSTIQCESLGVQYPHLFHHGDQWNYPNWRAEITGLQSKVDHMIANFRQLASKTTLYIMTASEESARSDRPIRMHEALRTIRGSDAAPFQLLVCVEGHDKPSDEDGISYRNYPVAYDYPDWTWLGHSASWDAIFDGFGLSADKKEILQ